MRRVDDRTIGWADYVGDRQYVSAGNTAVNDRVAMIFMDYPNQERLKVLGHIGATTSVKGRTWRRGWRSSATGRGWTCFVVVKVEAFDWNCPQHITPRFTLAEIEKLVAPLRERIAELEAQLAGSKREKGNME